MPRLDELSASLSELAKQGLLRSPGLGAPESAGLVACTNDYLGLGQRSVSRETLPSVPLGARASRLIHGTHPEHLQLEADLAAWVGAPSSLLYSSGYAANLGTVAALCDPSSYVVSDALNHASLIDGCRLSRATVAIAQHCDLDHIETLLRAAPPGGARWVLTESYFSMDGDSPALSDLRSLCDRYDAALLVDEAHALGVFGPRGAGLCADRRITADVLVGTLGKAVGSSGAFAAGSPELRLWLWNRARSFVFSTAPSPLLTALTRANVAAAQDADDLRATLQANARTLRTRLTSLGAALPPGNHGPIIPVLLADPHRALEAARRLADEGVVVQPIRPPTVPPGSSRLRITVTACMTPSDLDHLTHALQRVLGALA